MSVRGIFSGVLSLIVLQVVVSSNVAGSRLGSAGTGIASLIQRALSPAIPLIPDIRAPGGSVAASTAGAALTVPRKATVPAPPAHNTISV